VPSPEFNPQSFNNAEDSGSLVSPIAADLKSAATIMGRAARSSWPRRSAAR